jgi:hypothetical protein
MNYFKKIIKKLYGWLVFRPRYKGKTAYYGYSVAGTKSYLKLTPHISKLEKAKKFLNIYWIYILSFLVLVTLATTVVISNQPIKKEEGTMVFYHYKCNPGDTLTDIAIKYYGEPINYNIQNKIYEIRTVNNKANSDLDIGEIVIVPVFVKAVN